MLSLFALYVVCTTRFLIDELTGEPDAQFGFCHSEEGFDCVCDYDDVIEEEADIASGGVDVEVLRRDTDGDADNYDDFESWYDMIDGGASARAKERQAKAPRIVNGKMIDDQCEDKNENCTWWAEIGECENNPGFLMSNCPKSCNVCRAVNGFGKDIKCVRDPAEKPIVDAPGTFSILSTTRQQTTIYQFMQKCTLCDQGIAWCTFDVTRTAV